MVRASVAPRRLLSLAAGPTCHGARFAVAFDIDGVLTRAPNPIPGAKEALELLQAAGAPFALMTNGGGTTEALKAAQLSTLLGLAQPIHESQVAAARSAATPTAAFRPRPPSSSRCGPCCHRPASLCKVCLAHTPMRGLAEELGPDARVLLVGKHYPKLKAVASSYGLSHAVTVEELHAAHPHLYPDMEPHKPQNGILQAATPAVEGGFQVGSTPTPSLQTRPIHTHAAAFLCPWRRCCHVHMPGCSGDDGPAGVGS